MKSKSMLAKKVGGCLIVLSVLFFSVKFVSAQCPTYFNTKYRKVGLDYNYKLFDWNGDGFQDLYKIEVVQTQVNIRVILHNGNGDWNFNNPTVYTTNLHPDLAGNYLPLFDYDSDGDTDFAVYNPVTRILSTFRNNGNNTITEFGNTATDPDQIDLFITSFIDLNGDGIADLLGLYQQGGFLVGYRFGQANGTFSARINLFTGGRGNGYDYVTKVGDVTGDGKADIISTGVDAQFAYFSRVYVGNVNGTFSVVSNPPSGILFDAVDINNDGKVDVIKKKYQSATATYSLSTEISLGNGTFSVTDYSNPPIIDSNFTIGEFNGDTYPDVIQNGVNMYVIYTNNGSGVFTRQDYPITFSGQLSFSDHNGDGKDDFTTRSGNIFGEGIILVKENTCNRIGETKKANFDGDPGADLVTWNPTTGDWRSASKIGGFVQYDLTVRTFNWGLGSLGDVPALGDFDGDGKTDYSVYRTNTGTWYIYQSSNSSWLVINFGLAGDIAIPSDYNGGGKTDIAVFRPSDGNWYVFYTETQQFSVVHFGANGDKPVPEDYDGDGKTDFAVYRPSDGNWYYLKSSDLNPVVLHWGISTDKPLPADYDGDGKADLAVYRGGDWYILRSSNNAFSFIHWGNSTDLPMPFYENGNVAKLLLYRSSNRIWYNFSSSNSTIEWGQSGFVPIYFGLPNN